LSPERVAGFPLHLSNERTGTMTTSEPNGKLRLTRAQRRELKKADALGVIMIDGGFSGVSSRDYISDPRRDGRAIIERLVSRKLLWPGERFNQYVLTDAGRSAIQRKRSVSHAGA